jgi:hypothetical protein
MNIYQEAEKTLAELLGWTDSGYKSRETTYVTLYNVPNQMVMKPAVWTRDDAGAFKLIVEHGITVNYNIHPDFVIVRWFIGGLKKNKVIIKLEHHNNDKHLATRYAIVLAVIEKLRED